MDSQANLNAERAAFQVKLNAERDACDEVVRIVGVLSFFVWNEGLMLSRKTRRKIGEIAHEIQVSVVDVEKVMGIAIRQIFTEMFPLLIPDGGLAITGISASHEPTAKKLIQYYLREHRMLSGNQLKQMVENIAKWTDLSPHEIATVLEPILVGFVNESTQAIHDAFSFDEPETS